MKKIIISEDDLELYCEVKLLNEYNKFLNKNNLTNSDESYSKFLIKFLDERSSMKGKK